MAYLKTQNGCRWRGVAAGAIGGLVAGYAMNQFQALVSAVAKKIAPAKGEQKKGDDATVKTAAAISQHLCHHQLTDDEKKWAGPAVHYAFGTMLGALYGALAETVPVSQTGCGTVYGAAVWLGADEIAVPALGLSEAPSKSPPSVHAQALISHCVYGLTTDLVRRAVLKL